MLPLSLVASPLTCLSFHPVEAAMCQMSLELLLAWGKKVSQVFWEKLAGNLTFFSAIFCPSLNVDFVIPSERLSSFWFCKCAGVQTITVWLFFFFFSFSHPFLVIALGRRKRAEEMLAFNFSFPPFGHQSFSPVCT